jgi:hypothetical protein
MSCTLVAFVASPSKVKITSRLLLLPGTLHYTLNKNQGPLLLLWSLDKIRDHPHLSSVRRSSSPALAEVLLPPPFSFFHYVSPEHVHDTACFPFSFTKGTRDTCAYTHTCTYILNLSRFIVVNPFPHRSDTDSLKIKSHRQKSRCTRVVVFLFRRSTCDRVTHVQGEGYLYGAKELPLGGLQSMTTMEGNVVAGCTHVHQTFSP